MYTVIRLRPNKADPTRWDHRSRTIIGHKLTLADACEMACGMARLDDRGNARFFIRKVRGNGALPLPTLREGRIAR